MSTHLVICSLLVLVLHTELGSSKCRFENANAADEETNICYHKRDAKALTCPRDEKLVIKNIIHRVNEKCTGNEDCCKTRSNDRDYDIRHCLGHREPYRSAMREVLEECSQKRYCVLVSEVGSLIHQLRNTTVDGGKRAVSLVTAHECVKDTEPTVSFCKNNSVPHSKYVYISSQGMSLSDDNNCTCDVETTGNTNVTLLDVRLGTDPGNKLLLQTNTENEFTGGEDSLYFGHRVLVTDSRWTIHLSLSRHRVPGNVWMKVEGNTGSEIKVTCYEPRWKTDQTTLSTTQKPWGKTDQATLSLELKTTSTTQSSALSTSHVVFGVTSLVTCTTVCLAILFCLCIKRKNNSRQNPDRVIHYHPSSYITPEIGEYTDSGYDYAQEQSSAVHGEMSFQSDDDTAVYEPISQSKSDVTSKACGHSIPHMSKNHDRENQYENVTQPV